jgi:CheY-like chemotaxis protein
MSMPPTVASETRCGFINKSEYHLSAATGDVCGIATVSPFVTRTAARPLAMPFSAGPFVVCDRMEEPDPADDIASDERPRRILIADDEPRIRLAIRHCLESEGYEVEEATDGREAISAIVHGSPDLLLLDLAMPTLDGLSTLRLLSSIYNRVMPRVLVLTAHGSVTAAEMAYDLGAAGFLEKPFEPSTLIAAVGRALERPKS